MASRDGADLHVDHLLIGGGIAAATCARTLRERGAGGSVMLVSRELDPPYHRPAITKELLRGECTKEDTLISAPAWWDEHAVGLRLRTSVTALDPEARMATLSSKETVAYEQALLATGAMVRRLSLEGTELDGIHYLRALGNAATLRRDVEQLEEVVLVGGSYIGCEVAASLTRMGKRCTILMLEQVCFETAFGHRAGRFLQGVLEDHGVRVLPGREVVRFESGDGGGGAVVGEGEAPRVARVLTAQGDALETRAVVIGVGAIPDVALARRAGLELGERGGVRCDSRLRTSAPGLFAAGDMCEYDSVVHDRPMRIEHEQVAASQGATAAGNMLGDDRAHDEVPYFFSDLADWVALEYVGPASSWEREVVRGSLEDGRFSLWYLDAGRVVAALSVGRSPDLDDARRLIASRADVSGHESTLADPDTDLSAIVA